MAHAELFDAMRELDLSDGVEDGQVTPQRERPTAANQKKKKR